MSNIQRAVFIALCYFLFSFGYIISNGFYHVGELIILLSVSIIIFIFYLNPRYLTNLRIPSDEKSLIFILSLIFLINIALLGAKLGDTSQANWQFYSAANRVLAGSTMLLALTFFFKKTSNFLFKYRFIVILGIASLIRIFSIISSPNPTIDVFYLLRDGPKEILHGKNPYELNYQSPYGVYIPRIIFVYGPLTPFIFAPSVFLFNDPRYTLVAADLLSALFIYKLANKLVVKPIFRKLIMIIFLFHPLFPFMTEQSWLEPIMTLLLFASTYFLLTAPRKIIGGALLGAILAVKSVYLLPILTFLTSRKAGVSQYLTTLSVPVIFSLPFLIANKELFLERTQAYVTNPSFIQGNLAPTHISLSVAALVLKYTGLIIPIWFVAASGIGASILLVLKGEKSLPFNILSLFLVFIILFMLGPFMFLNYFAFLGNILLLALLCFLSKKEIPERV